MNIALMAHDNKKDLMVQFCTAYAGIHVGLSAKGIAPVVHLAHAEGKAVGGAGHNTKVATLATAFVHYYGTFDFSHNIYVGCLVVWFLGRFAQKYN